MSTRWEWFKVACEIAEMLQDEPQDQRPAIMAQLLMDVQDELEAGPGNRARMREAMERYEGYSVKVPPLRLVEDEG